MAKRVTMASILKRVAKPKVDKAARRRQREQELGDMARALPGGKYAVIYADPPWRFEVRSEKGMDRAADNHYPTMTTADIADLRVPAAPNCVLFLWATVPMLPDAMVVLSSWGFTYKSHFVWVKESPGTGYWARNQHELLLIGTRGDVPSPLSPWVSAVTAPRTMHSVKPEAFHQMIEAYFPTVPKLEMFARQRRPGWTVWGLEAPE